MPITYRTAAATRPAAPEFNQTAAEAIRARARRRTLPNPTQHDSLQASAPRFAHYRSLLGWVGPVLAVVLAAGAFWAFHEMSRGLRFADISSALTRISPAAVGLAAIATVIGYTAIGCYDIVATRVVAGGRVDPRLAAWSGATGFAFSNMLGFHMMTGGMVRFRTYQNSGLDAGEIGQVVLLTWTGLWLGLATLGGLMLLVDPLGFRALGVLHPAIEKGLGLALLLAVVALFALVGPNGRAFAIRGWRLPLPGRRQLLLQLLLGSTDLLGAAFALWVLLPADVVPAPALFMIVYLVATVLGAASHVPGGIGVFEATIIAGLGLQGRADVISALLVYRVIYYLVPFCLAAASLAIFEGEGLRAWAHPRLRDASRALRSFVPAASALIVFFAGLVLLFTGTLPASPERLVALRRMLPLPLVETSHFLSAQAGLFLMVIANGLLRRLYTAWALAMILLVTGAVFALVRGLDWEPAAVLSAIALVLLLARGAFFRRTPGRLGRIPWSWLGVVAVALAVTIWIGFLLHTQVPYSDALWVRFAWSAEAPRFLRASLGMLAAMAAIALHLALTRPAPRSRGTSSNIPAAVADLVERSSDTQSNLAFLGDKEFLVGPEGRAFVMYARSGRSIIALGGPVGDVASGEELTWQFRELADTEGLRTVFYGIGPEALPLYLDMGFAFLKLGEVARVDLQRFTLKGPAAQEFRYADKRATRDGLDFAVVPRAEVPALMPDLRAVSDAWLAQKHGGEKGFSLGSFDPVYLAHFDCAVMRRDGEIVAFANLWRGGDRTEIAPDLMRFRPNVSNVLMDALFVRLIVMAQSHGYRWLNLGSAPLAGLSQHPLASTWSRMGTQVFRRGEDFYHFEGLRAFKQKFDPVWTPRYLACRGGLAIPQVLLDVTRLISRNRPLRERGDAGAALAGTGAAVARPSLTCW